VGKREPQASDGAESEPERREFCRIVAVAERGPRAAAQARGLSRALLRCDALFRQPDGDAGLLADSHV